MTEVKTEIEKIFKPYRLAKKVELDTGHKAFTEVYNEEIIQDLIQLFNKHIEDIPLTGLVEVFDKYKVEHPSGQGHIFYDVYFISMVQDIINILKIKE